MSFPTFCKNLFSLLSCHFEPTSSVGKIPLGFVTSQVIFFFYKTTKYQYILNNKNNKYRFPHLFCSFRRIKLITNRQ